MNDRKSDIMKKYKASTGVSEKNAASPEHRQVLSVLAARMTEVFNRADIADELKYDMTCRLIARSIGANSVSILLYYGESNMLQTVGMYVNPRENFANIQYAENHNPKSQLTEVLTYMGIFEFLRVRYSNDWGVSEYDGCHDKMQFIKDRYHEYFEFHFTNPLPVRLDRFANVLTAFYADSRQYKEDYFRFKRMLQKRYAIQPILENGKEASGMYYYMLTHSDEDLNLHGQKPDASTQFLFLDISKHADISKKVPLLDRSLEVQVTKDRYYIGIPIIVDKRIMGIVRIKLNEKLELHIPGLDGDMEKPKEENYLLSDNTDVRKYIIETLRFENISLLLSQYIANIHYENTMRHITLSTNLQDFLGKDMNEVAEELRRVANCRGCIIRHTNFINDYARIMGYSPHVEPYTTSIKKSDPYIGANGRFMNVLIETFYPTDTPGSEKVQKIECVRIEFDRDGKYSTTYWGFDKVYHLREISDKSKYDKALDHLYRAIGKNMPEAGFSSFVLIPIKNWNYGFVNFANTSNRKFIDKDMEMLIPVVNRFGLYLNDRLKEQEAINIHKNKLEESQRFIFHQLISPASRLYENFLMMKEDDLPRNKRAIALENMENNLQVYLEMLRAINFVTKYTSGENIKPEITSTYLSSFVLDKVRIYQTSASIEKNIRIHVTTPESLSTKEGARYGYGPIRTDENLLSHVIQALIDNAIKYSYNHHYTRDKINTDVNYPPANRKDKNVINVHIERQKSYFSIEIENWGCKIEKAEKQDVTNKYFRGATAKEFESEGSGIGLYMVQKITEALNGELGINSDDDHTMIKVIYHQ